VTHRPIRILEDGTHVYASYHRYKPMADEDRTNKINKPKDPRAVRFHALWFLPLELLDDEQRVMPPTRPDSQTLEHRGWCTCEVCSRPAARTVWRVQRERLYRGKSN
jgi:hypothetical protein